MLCIIYSVYGPTCVVASCVLSASHYSIIIHAGMPWPAGWVKILNPFLEYL